MNRNILHKVIVVDFIINVAIFLLAILYGYRVMFYNSNSSESMVGTCLIFLFIATVLLTYDVIYLYQHSKVDSTFGMAKIMAIASIVAKGIVLLGALVMVCFVGPSKFLSGFNVFF